MGSDNANLFLKKVDKISVLLILRRNGAIIGEDCDIETGLTFHNCKDYSNLIIGNNCHIGKNCFFDLRGNINIKDNVVISMQCTFITHIDMNKSELSQNYPSSAGKIIIYNDCYIGANSTILMNTKLGNHSFVAAGSLITKNIPEFTMVGGVPAKKIKGIN